MNLKPLVLLAPLFLSGCLSSSIRSVAEEPIRIKIPASLKQACQGVVKIPHRDLSTAEVARLWGKDRSALGDCVRRHGGLAASIKALEEAQK